MKSSIASLRDLTLPFGATTGARIELDGVTGEIRVYDSSGNLQISISPDAGIQVFDDTGDERLALGLIFAGVYSIIRMSSGVANETPGLVSLYDTTLRNRMVLAPGERDGKGSLEWTIVSSDAAELGSSLLQVVALSLEATSGQPYIDLTGASAATVGQRPITVVSELYRGTPNLYMQNPNLEGTYGRGVLDYAETATPVGGITTTDTDVGLQISWTAEATHAYKVTAHNNRGLASTAANDLMRAKLADAGGADTEQANVTAIVANRAFAYTVVEFVSGTTGTVTRKVQVVRGAGAGTITHDAAAGSLARLWVEDVGG